VLAKVKKIGGGEKGIYQPINIFKLGVGRKKRKITRRKRPWALGRVEKSNRSAFRGRNVGGKKPN